VITARPPRECAFFRADARLTNGRQPKPRSRLPHVVQFVVHWGGREKETPPISIGAAVLQFLLSIMTIPAVKLLPPSALYQPEIGPSPEALLVTLAVSIALLPPVYVLWSGRIELSAPAEQQREAEDQGGSRAYMRMMISKMMRIRTRRPPPMYIWNLLSRADWSSIPAQHRKTNTADASGGRDEQRLEA
jgi:hypothetical protein